MIARRRLLAREPNRQKVEARANEIWQRRGGGVTSAEQAQANYFEAQRQIEIEERAHGLAQARGGGDDVANYYEAERAIAAERAPAVLPVAQPAPAVVPAVVAVANPQPAKFVAPHLRPGYQARAPVANANPVAALPPGWRDAGQLRGLGFRHEMARDQLNKPDWHGFHVHLSVNPSRGAFNEFHVKFDLGNQHRIFYFFDAAGTADWNKSSRQPAVRAALRAAGCPEQHVGGELANLDRKARDLADEFVGTLR
jgi:hypothetical protein